MALIYESIYKKLLKLAPELWTMKPGDALKSRLGAPMMDLNLDVLDKDKKNIIIALSHYYKHESGDMIADPDMEIRVFSQGFAEALAYQDCFGYLRVYSDDETQVYPKRKKTQNSFLSQWLSNCISQGHKLLPYK